jgi:hypothetical protein
MTSTNFWSFAEKPNTQPPVYRDMDNCYNYNRTFDVCTIHDLLTRLPEFLDEEVCLHYDFILALTTVLMTSVIQHDKKEGHYAVQGTDFVHVVYHGDEPQTVVYHGETINDQLVLADHKRYNLSIKGDN